MATAGQSGLPGMGCFKVSGQDSGGQAHSRDPGGQHRWASGPSRPFTQEARGPAGLERGLPLREAAAPKALRPAGRQVDFLPTVQEVPQLRLQLLLDRNGLLFYAAADPRAGNVRNGAGLLLRPALAHVLPTPRLWLGDLLRRLRGRRGCLPERARHGRGLGFLFESWSSYGSDCQRSSPAHRGLWGHRRGTEGAGAFGCGDRLLRAC